MVEYDPLVRAADTAAGISIGGAVVTQLATFNIVIQLFAGIVAIVAGVMAALFHYERWRALRLQKIAEEAEEK